MKNENESNINISSLINEGIARIMMSGELNFGSRKRFKDIAEPLLSNDKVNSIVIEMGQVSDIGTGGMGILYLMNERCVTAKKNLKILHPVGKVKDWLAIANEGNIFNIG